MPIAVYARIFLFQSLGEVGRFAEAAECAAQTLRLAEPTQHAFAISETLFAAGRLHSLQGEWAQARSLIERGLAVLRPTNIVFGLPLAVALSAWVLAQDGETREALTRLRESEDLLERDSAKEIIGHRAVASFWLGRASLRLGKIDEARSLSERTVELAHARPALAPHALHLLAEIAALPARFDPERAETHYRAALGLAESRGMRPLVAHCHRGLGRLYDGLEKGQQAGEHLAAATTMYREMDMRFWLEQVM